MDKPSDISINYNQNYIISKDSNLIIKLERKKRPRKCSFLIPDIFIATIFESQGNLNFNFPR